MNALLLEIQAIAADLRDGLERSQALARRGDASPLDEAIRFAERAGILSGTVTAAITALERAHGMALTTDKNARLEESLRRRGWLKSETGAEP